MNINSDQLFKIYENYYAVKNSSTYFRDKEAEVPVFFTFINNPFFMSFKEEIKKDNYVTEIRDVTVWDYVLCDMEGSHKTMITEYTNELMDIKEAYKCCQRFKTILEDEISGQFIDNNESYFGFSIAEIREDIINIRSTLACMYFELTNNPIGYFDEKNECLVSIND
jgi:hypothetical protein